jgi:hypothetical protein
MKRFLCFKNLSGCFLRDCFSAKKVQLKYTALLILSILNFASCSPGEVRSGDLKQLSIDKYLIGTDSCIYILSATTGKTITVIKRK